MEDVLKRTREKVIDEDLKAGTEGFQYSYDKNKKNCKSRCSLNRKYAVWFCHDRF